MIQEQGQQQSIIPLLKSYNASLIFTIISIQAALSFAIPFFTSSIVLLSCAMVISVLVLHLLGTYSFHLSLKHLGVHRPRMIALYLLVPFGNIFCMVALSKAVNADLNAIGATRQMSYADVKAIERHALDQHG